MRGNQLRSSTSAHIPLFPDFRQIELADREIIHSAFQAYQPQTSELTFTNLFMWRHYYRFRWSMYGDYLVVFSNPLGWGYSLMLPVGPAPRNRIMEDLLKWMKSEKEDYESCIGRADDRLVQEIQSDSRYSIEKIPDHFDYLYRTQDLIELNGRKYHGKKNHLNRFRKQFEFEYRPITDALREPCIHVLKRWCNWKECDKNPIIRAEFEAVHEALLHFNSLKLDGGSVLVNNEIVAFSLGEMLNAQTAVIHAEKADPRIPELFTVINQQFCEHQYSPVPFINREQDLGQPGLRRAKRSYHPVQMIEKYRICPKSDP
jgi:hypothetical protein